MAWSDHGSRQKKGGGVLMKTVRHVELYLDEDVLTRTGTVENQFVPHKLAVDDVFEMILNSLNAVNAILTPVEMKDRLATLEKALAALRSGLGTEAVDRAHLTIHGG
jgi:hypothetical protein